MHGSDAECMGARAKPMCSAIREHTTSTTHTPRLVLYAYNIQPNTVHTAYKKNTVWQHCPKYLDAIWEYKEKDAFTFFDKMRTHLVSDLAKMNEKTLAPAVHSRRARMGFAGC
jgi:hypothetical protein